jgi:Xaa-Pro aminopeptidase
VDLIPRVSSRRSSRAAPRAVLLYADSDHNADQLYFGQFSVPDAYIALGIGRRKIGVLNALEFGRALKESDFDEVLAYEDWQARAKKTLRVEQAGPAEVITALARSFKLRAFRVNADFPVGLAFKLQARGLRIEPTDGTLFPEREIKSDAEARLLAEGNRCSATGIAAAEETLRRATIRNSRLWLDGKPLTSERVREAVDVACLRAGGMAINTIVAGGDQACDPHCRGAGPLRAHQLIIVDVFPRIMKTGYFGDMTRTFLKGTPGDAQAKLVAAVRAGQKFGLRAIRHGANGRKIHEAITAQFAAADFPTRREKHGWIGFFHGTGHGVGLEIHEAPRINRADYRLRRGSVVTVEPGLYYPGLGGCRIEDVVQVTSGPVRMLSRFHYDWVIR